MAKQLLQPDGLPQIKEGLGKKEISDLAHASVDSVLEHGNVFRIAEALAAMEEFVKQVRKDERFVDVLRDELLKHHGQLKTPSGAKLEVCEAGVSYDYAHDASWRFLTGQIARLTEERKALEEKLRKVAPGKMAVDPETGEILEGPRKTSKSTYRITLAR
ncbi:MAG TPA: hypothetical protein VHK69_03700 [Chitinophagaceae bacterium]|jgi:hypothetical protein|nr:hypothetical protein [Chitinophagaceae bacterium]